MFDRLLGRGGDEERRIRELEAELAEREKQLEVARARQEKAEERRKSAAAEKQEAQRRRNVLEERVRNLEAEIQLLKEEKEEGTPEHGFSRVLSVPSGDLVTRLSTYRSPTNDLVTLQSNDLSGEDVLNDLEGDLSPALRFEGPGILYHDQRGVLSLVADPPVLRGDPSMMYDETFDTAPLDAEDLRRSHVMCFVRSDEAAVARVDEGEITEFRHLSADVMSKHTKGGFSQKRFERLREEQVKKHVEDTEQMLRSVLRKDDFVALGGDSSVASRVASALDLDEKRCAVKPLSIHDVEDEEDMLRAEERFWSVQIYVL